MVSWNLENFVRDINSWGLLDVLLPFLLIFTLFYAVLHKTKVFGDDKKNINIVVSLIIGLIVVIPHVTNTYPADWDVVNIINGALPAIAAVVVAVIMLLILIGAWGGQAKWTKGSLATWIFIISLLIVIWAFGAAAGRLPGWDWVRDMFGQEAIAIIIILLVFAIIIAFITSGDKGTQQGSKMANIGQSIGEFFGGGK
ncbi:MAG: hypothetical protein ABII01_04875 [Candidatus Woesearchaeota archaeon]